MATQGNPGAYVGQLGGTRTLIVAPAPRPPHSMPRGRAPTPVGDRFNPAAVAEEVTSEIPTQKTIQLGAGHGKGQSGCGDRSGRHRKLSRAMEKRLGAHAAEHGKAHIAHMKKDIESGMTFKRAHARALAAVGE